MVTLRRILYLFMLVATVSADLFGQVKPRPLPSLDVLVIRVKSYWDLLERGRKLEALAYIEPSSRENFLERQVPEFSNPRITNLEFSGKNSEISVTVTVKRFLQPIGYLDWPVNEKWVFRNGKWLAVIIGKELPYPVTAGGHPPAPLSPDEIGNRQSEVRAALQFDKQLLDFGTLRKGEMGHMELKYSLSGSEPMGIAFKNAPTDLIFEGLHDRQLMPGDNHTIALRWITANSDGAISAPFTILIQHRGVDTPYQFELRGFVYSPASAVPSRVLLLKDQKVKEIKVRNNSQSDIEIRSFSTQTGVLKAWALPLVLTPGSEATLTVTLTAVIGVKNYQEVLSLDFAKPVEGMSSLIIPVVINYEEKPQERGIMGLTQKELDELLRKAGHPPGKP